MGNCSCIGPGKEEGGATIDVPSHSKTGLTSSCKNDPEVLIETELKEEDMRSTQGIPHSYLTRPSLSLPPEEIYHNLLSPAAAEIRKALPSWLQVSDKEIKPLSDGSSYIGDFDNKENLTGTGCIYTSDGGLLEGSFLQGKLHGRGRKIFPDGDIYTGDFH